MHNNRLISGLLSVSVLLGILTGCTSQVQAPETGIEDNKVIEALSGNGATGIQITSHNFEQISDSEFGGQYSARDTVCLSYQAGDLGGVLPQTVSKNSVYYFNRETGAWDLLEETTTACEVDNTIIRGSCWKCDSLDQDTINKLMGEEAPSGTLYIKILKNMGLFAFNLENGDYTST